MSLTDLQPVATWSDPTRSDPTRLRGVLADVLADLDFPARRWQVITAAELYGADAGLRTALHTLAAPGYRSVDDVVEALTGPPTAAPGPDPRTAAASSTRPPARPVTPTTRRPLPDRRSAAWSTRHITAR